MGIIRRIGGGLKRRILGGVSRLLGFAKSTVPLAMTFILLASAVYLFLRYSSGENVVQNASLISSVALTGVLAHLYYRISRIQAEQSSILERQTELSEAEHAPVIVVDDLSLRGNVFELTLSNVGKGIASNICYQAVYVPARVDESTNSAFAIAGYSEGHVHPNAMFPLQRREAGGGNYLQSGETTVSFRNKLLVRKPAESGFIITLANHRDAFLEEGITKIILQIQLDYGYQSPISKRLVHGLEPVVLDLETGEYLHEIQLKDVTPILGGSQDYTHDNTPIIIRGRYNREEVETRSSNPGSIKMLREEVE